jgi:hypothetical protein
LKLLVVGRLLEVRETDDVVADPQLPATVLAEFVGA